MTVVPIAVGERLYGKVDRLPGVFYVATMFSHLGFIPIWPRGTYLVIDGSEDEKAFGGMTFRGIPIRASAGQLRWRTRLLFC